MLFELDYDWRRFAHSVRKSLRFIVCPSMFSDDRTVGDPQLNFLIALRESSRHRVSKIKTGTILWRAQLGGTSNPGVELPEYGPDIISNTFLGPYGPDRMIPLADKATEGRVNPKGIPCLYVAADGETAMAEVKPAVGSHITLAEFHTERELTLVDFTLHPGPIFDDAVEYATALENLAWADLNDAFSKPVTASDNVADYAPTQIVAEVFKCAGYDGLLYRSAIDENGVNAALFDRGCVKFKSASLYRAKSVKFTFERERDDRVFDKPPPEVV